MGLWLWLRVAVCRCVAVAVAVAVAVWVGGWLWLWLCALLLRHWVVRHSPQPLCLQDDPLVMELTWAGIATMTDAQRLILDQQALLDL